MHSPTVKDIATATLSLIAVIVVLKQCRKPAWWPGRLLLWTMNVRHAGVTNWGLTHVLIEKRFTILDVGCGGGRTVKTLAAIASEGKVYGIDYSAASVATSRRTNVRWIEAGRVDIRQGSVSQLPPRTPLSGRLFRDPDVRGTQEGVDLRSRQKTHVDDMRPSRPLTAQSFKL